MRIFEDTENRTETGQKAEARLPKSHQDFWRTRLKRRTYLDPIKGRVEVPEWQVRMFHQGREGWFNLQTANQGIAAIKAKDIYLSLKSQGWEATLAKFKPSERPKAASCSIGDFVAALEEKAGFRLRTLTIYLTKFRKLVSDIAGIEKGLKAAARKGKFDYVNGRRAEWLGKIHRQPIGLLTPDSINA